MRRILATLVLLAACKSGDGGTGPTPVASVSVTAPSTTIATGQQITLTATARDASGNTLTGRAVSWASSAPAVASVSAAGVVQGLTAGQTTITGTIEGKQGQVAITVTGAVASCTTVTPLTVAVGEVHTLTTAERQQLCLAAGASGGEFILIPF
ncbi:MAG TPA: Ig-like domain-containing protein, partial [Gemmatimonadaceae bacterium]|nr:Ig-like domain-containing protein [Gemmatimonadaceae bacterium]